MSRPRHFTKAEIFDAARAAAETGLVALLHPTGEIEFAHAPKKRQSASTAPEDALEGWLHGGGKTRGPA